MREGELHEVELKWIATYSEKLRRMNNEIGGSMTDKMVDVGGRRRPATLTSVADIFGHQADVGRWHFFPVRRRRPECRRVSSADIVGPVFWQSGRRRRTTLADTRRHSGRHSVCYPSDYNNHLWMVRGLVHVYEHPSPTNGGFALYNI